MDFGFSEEQEIIRQTARDFAQNEILPQLWTQGVAPKRTIDQTTNEN